MTLQRVHKDSRWVHLATLGDSQRRSLRLDRERANVLFLDIADEVLVVLAFGGMKGAVGPDGEKLPDLFVERQLLERLRDPALGLWGKLRRLCRSRCTRRLLCAARGSHE